MIYKGKPAIGIKLYAIDGLIQDYQLSPTSRPGCEAQDFKKELGS